ncbi:hypothetical protein [Aceticella autotrophica]|uniref:hypothetical protein n=1 Tax=Aceticella autotrophica TaxID=2755338 RepID=UPI003D6DE6CB
MKKLIISFLMLVIFFSLSSNSAYSASIPQNNKKAVLVIIDRVNLNDYLKNNAKNIQKLINDGAIGLMNTQTANDYIQSSAYLTIGTGTRASTSGDFSSISLNSFENYLYGNAESLYRLNTGLTPGNNDILNIGISKLIEASKKENYQITPGLLGQILKENNIPVYVFGNADSKDENGTVYKRYAALIAMDKNGVSHGDVSGDILKKDNNSPFFIKTDYDKLYENYKKIEKSGGLFIFDTGDTSRVNDFSRYTSSDVTSRLKKNAIIDADNFIGNIVKSLDLSKDILIIATPFPSRNDITSNNLITPLIIDGPNYHGLTISKTTKREGIIVNTDIAPTILSYFNLKLPVEMLGHPISSINSSNKLNYLNNLDTTIVSTHNARPIVLKSYVIFLIIVLILYLTMFFLKIEILRFIKPIILGIMSVPLILLILPLFGTQSIYVDFILIISITIAFVSLLKISVKNELDIFMIISLLTSFAIALDIFTGSHLMKDSILGYDAIAGARFYGIGNEYMGVLIGSTIMGIMTLIQKYDSKYVKVLSIAVFIAVFMLMILPGYGAKIGGFITGFMAFGVTILMMLGVKINHKNLTLLFISMTVLLFLMFIASMFIGTETHMAQTAIIVKYGGIQSLFDIFNRKLNMELTLIRYTIWSWVLIISIISLFIFSYKPTGILKNIFKKYEYIYYGFFGSTIGMLFALAFNDAGIVAAATLSIYAIPPILILLQNEMYK